MEAKLRAERSHRAVLLAIVPSICAIEPVTWMLEEIGGFGRECGSMLEEVE